MKNINEVREEACKLFAEMRAGTLPGKEAKEMNNALGKIIATVNAEIKYGTAGNKVPNIPFMEYDK